MEGSQEEVASKLQVPLVPLHVVHDEEDDELAPGTPYDVEDPASPEGFASPASTSALSERGHAEDASTLAQHLSNLDYAAEFGRDWKSAHVNHRFTREERQRLSNVESIDYLPPNSHVFRVWLAGQPHRRLWDRWLMMGAIGVMVGFFGYLLFLVIAFFEDVKYNGTNWLLRHAGVFVAWIFNMLVSCGLAAAAAWPVVHVAPAAAGAGVAEVMAYLNGCSMPKIFNARTLGVKFASCACAVGSGLPVGPEGPMIHIGAMLGAGLSQGHSTTLGLNTDLFTRFRNPKDKRDFVTAGSGIGVAVAFSAPIGGLLFASEEVASWFTTSLGWQIFFGCMISVLALDTCRSAQRAITHGEFGLFEGDASTVFFEVQTVLSNHVAAVLPAAVIGLACGAFGIIFTVMNLKVTRLRELYIGGDKRRRFLEPIIFIGVFVTVAMVLPLFFPCTRTDCVIEQGSSAPVCRAEITENVLRITESRLEQYTCPQSLFNSTARPGPVQGLYNELATLMDVPGDAIIRHLLTRGTHRQFGYAALIVTLVTYFISAAWIAGSAISSGVFVPMLVIGSLIGRILGLAAVDMAAALGRGSAGAPPGVFLPPSAWAWIDPGVFALIGAGSFMGGVTRLTVALAVIMMEMSNDVRMLLPTLVGIMVAKWVGDAATHSLYHGQLAVKCVPWLPEEPAAALDLDLLPVSAVMRAPVVTLQERMRVAELRKVMRNTSHNGFPVTRHTAHGEVVVGLILRDHIMVLLRQALGRGSASAVDASWEELNRRYVSTEAQRLVSEQQLAVLQADDAEAESEKQAADGGSLAEQEMDLTPYVNSSAVRVDRTFSLLRAYMVFRTLGLRHLIITGAANHVRGIVTRKDLLGYRLDAAVQRYSNSGRQTGAGWRTSSFMSLARS